MIESNMDCRTCTRDGYSECLCSFCMRCGSFGHSRDSCAQGFCRQCREEHAVDACPLIEYEADEAPLPTPSDEFQLSGSSQAINIADSTTTCVSGTQVSTAHYHRTSLGVIDRALILKHLIRRIRIKYKERYTKLLNSIDVATVLEEGLSPAVRDICEQGKFTLSSLIGIGGNPEQLEATGVYLHILWPRNMAECFWLYIGQATKLCVRISTHNNPYRRGRQPSLHYTIWNSWEGMESKFVTLATQKEVVTIEDQLLLNLQEMWMSLIFQTLRGVHLDEFLPTEIEKLWAGNHLNVALPLWQSFTAVPSADAIGGRIAFQQYLFNADPLVRQWAQNSRDAFNDIRNSSDPELRRYYHTLQKTRQQHIHDTWDNKKSAALQGYLSGKKAIVKADHDCYRVIPIGSYIFRISQRLGLQINVGDEVLVHFDLSDTPHPYAYTSKARIDDPAYRLGVSIRGYTISGEYFCWLITNRDLNVLKMNSLVDILEGYSWKDTASFKRRWHLRRLIPGEPSSRTNVYT